jgi:hypothetical protein
MASRSKDFEWFLKRSLRFNSSGRRKEGGVKYSIASWNSQLVVAHLRVSVFIGLFQAQERLAIVAALSQLRQPLSQSALENASPASYQGRRKGATLLTNHDHIRIRSRRLRP